jgi:prepilin-type processing-associated H-X9-DG protein
MFHPNPDDPYDTWAAGDVGDLPDQTNAVLLSRSRLGPYAKNVSIYRCPSDVCAARVRTMSMNNYMGGIGSMALFTNQFVLNISLPSISVPASAFVFLDESAATLSDAYFVVSLTTNYAKISPIDIPASYHLNSGNYSFADGHAQTKHWQTRLFAEGMNTKKFILDSRNNPDYIWLMKNTTMPITGIWPE